MSSRSSKLKRKDRTLFVCAELVYHLLPTYATDDVIAGTLSDNESLTEGQIIPANVYSDALCTNMLRSGQVYGVDWL